MKNLSQKKNFLTLTNSALILFALLLQNCDTPKMKSATFIFSATIGTEPLVIGSKRYRTPNNEGEFAIENFKLYVSNIMFIDSSRNKFHKEKNSYHLVRFDAQKNTFEFTINSIPIDTFDEIKFSIGIDSVKNKSIDHIGDLDPNGQMAWNWNVGYKFLVLEGNYFTNEGSIVKPLVFHIGFSENYQPLSYDVAKSNLLRSDTIHFNIDIESMFTSPNIINFDSLSSITFNRKKAKLVAANFKEMIRLKK